MSKFLTFSILMVGFTMPAAAGNYYVGASAVDTDYGENSPSVSDNGVAYTVGRKLNLSKVVDTAIEFSIGKLLDKTHQIAGIDLDSEVESKELSLVLSKQFGSVSPFVRLGYADTELTVRAVSVVNADDKGTYYGLGLDYALSDSLFLRLEMDDREFKYNGSTSDVETSRLGIFKRF